MKTLTSLSSIEYLLSSIEYLSVVMHNAIDSSMDGPIKDNHKAAGIYFIAFILIG